MRLASHIKVRLVAGPGNAEVPRCEIVVGANATGQVIDGAYLEAAIQWRDCYLLFLTDDAPFEESLRIYLMDTRWRVVDAAVIGGIYTTGSFSDLVIVNHDCARVRFIGNTDWEVELLEHPRFRLPWLGEPAGVKRSFGFKQHFVVRGDPQPAR